MTTTRFDLPAARLADAQTLVARFARKAAKLGMSAPTLTVIREYTRIWTTSRSGDVLGGPWDALPQVFLADKIRTTALDMAEVEIDGERPVIAGWQFAAVIESTPAGNIMRKHPRHEGDLPLRFRACTSECDHCRKVRSRRETFVVQRVDGSEYMQVGRSCLKDFLGAASPEAWMAAFQMLKSIEGLAAWDEDGCGGFGFGAPAVPTDGFLVCCAALVRTEGYVSAAAARDRFGVMTTGMSVWHTLTAKHGEGSEWLRDIVTDADRALVARALDWLASPDAGDSDYIHNVRVYAAQPCVRSRGTDMLASLIQSYRRAAGELVARAVKVNEYLPGAEVGSKVDRMLLTLVRASGYDTDYGYKHVLSFEDADGRSIMWRTTATHELETGVAYFVTGKVKKLDRYKDRAQTELTRCVIDHYACESTEAPACSVAIGSTKIKAPRKTGEVVEMVAAPTVDGCIEPEPVDVFDAFECAA